MEELVARIIGKLDETKKQIRFDSSLSAEESNSLIKEIEQKKKEVLTSRLIGYEIAREIYVNKNRNNLKELKLNDHIQAKTIREALEGVKNNLSDEEIEAIIKSRMQSYEDLARFFIEKEVNNPIFFDDMVYELFKEIIPDEHVFSYKYERAYDYAINRIDDILFGEILADADTFINTMYASQELLNEYMKEATISKKM